MKVAKCPLLISTVILLSACGGGGGSSPSPAKTEGNNEVPGKSAELIFKFADEPLHPRVFNLKASDKTQENQFSPGDTIGVIWGAQLFYSNNSTIRAGEYFLYDADIYLSVDETLQASEDLKLFSIECSFPSTVKHACGDSASFQCVYAKDNQGTISCTSIPLNREKGIADLTVDTGIFVDTIPKTVNVLFRACLRKLPDKCAERYYPMQLN